jgi:hypothetical protein
VTDDDEERLRRLADALRANDADALEDAADAILDALRDRIDEATAPTQEPAVPSRRQRLARLTAEVDRIPPSAETVEAARTVVLRRIVAKIARATGEDVEVPAPDPLAEAVLLQRTRAGGRPVDTPAQVEAARERLRRTIAGS